MIFSRVILSLGSKRSQSACLQRICAVNEVPFRSQHSVSVSHCQQARALRLKPPAQRFRFQVTAPSYHHLLAVCDMQPASISYGRDTTAVASDEDDEGDGGDENLAGKEVGEEHKELREMVMTSAQTGAVGMEVQESPADTEAASVSTPSGSNEKKTRRKLTFWKD